MMEHVSKMVSTAVVSTPLILAVWFDQHWGVHAVTMTWSLFAFLLIWRPKIEIKVQKKED